jgi:hypothetical protein
MGSPARRKSDRLVANGIQKEVVHLCQIDSADDRERAGDHRSDPSRVFLLRQCHLRVGWSMDVGTTGEDVSVVTVDDVRTVLAGLPRSTEVLVRDRVKFRVGQIVYVAFSQDETEMGFAFPKEERAALVAARPDVFFLPRESDLRFHWVEAWLDALDTDEMREMVLDAWRMVVPQRVAREVLGPPAVDHDPGRNG